MAFHDSELRIIIGISGSGSTMVAAREAMWAQTEYGYIPKTRLVGVFSPNPLASGLVKARQFKELDPQKDVQVIQKAKDHSTLQQQRYGERMIGFFENHPFDIFCQYGLSDWTPPNVIDWLQNFGKFGINQHGACVNPDNYDFGGQWMSCPQRFHATRLMFVRETGRNFWQDPVAQRIAKTYDGGRVLRRGRVVIAPSDTVEGLQDRAIKEERKVQIATLSDFENNTVCEQSPYDDLVRVEERKLLRTVKQVARRLYTAEGELIEVPKLAIIKIDDDLVTEEYAYHLASLLQPS